MTEAARALLGVLDDAQLGSAILALDDKERSHWSNVPYAAHHRPGLRLGSLDKAEMLRVHDLLRALVEEYVRNADFDAADEQLSAIDAAGWDKVAFTWRGPVGDLKQPFYYRVQGPRISIELRNTDNHVHTVTRDPVNDYGEAWLGLTYVETITAAERSAAARRAAE